MLLNIKENENCKKRCVFELIWSDIFDDKASLRLEKLNKVGKITVDDLIEKLHEEKFVRIGFENTLWYDFSLVLADKVLENKEFCNLFKDLYKEKYPEVFELFLKIKWFEDWEKIEKLSKDEMFFFKFLIYDAELFVKFDLCLGVIDPKDDLDNYFEMYDSELKYNDDTLSEMKFSDTEESIIKSPLFEKYIIKRRKELADYVGVAEEELDEYFHEKMRSYFDKESPESQNHEYLAIDMAGMLLARQGGNMSWYDEVVLDKFGEKKGFSYRPDVSFLIRGYFKALFAEKYCLYKDKKEKFTKLTLSRECKEDFQTELNAIYYSYVMDVLVRMLFIEKEGFYRRIIWNIEPCSESDMIYKKEIDKLNKIVLMQEEKIKKLSDERTSLLLQNNKKTDEKIRAVTRKHEKALKELSEKQNEINQLKECIKSQNEFMDLLLQEEPENIEIIEPIDMERLMTKRYLFVGNIDEANHQFVFESEEIRYCGDLRYTLEERFDWMYDAEVWLQGFFDEEIRDYIITIQSFQRERLLKDIRNTALTLDTDEYLLLSLSDQNASFYSNGLYCEAKIHQYPQVKLEKHSDGTTVFMDIHNGKQKEELVESAYKIKGDNVIELFGTKVSDGKVYILNCGKSNLYLATIFGRFCIPNNNRLYRISGNVLRGRVPVY